MEEDGDTDGPQKTKSQEPSGPVMGPIYFMWEHALEKLKILNYETAFCAQKGKRAFSRVHFVVPGKNLSHQFEDFVDICAWLCTDISKNPDLFKRDQFDDPTTVANKLLLALRQLDFKASFSAQKLKTPHGEAVCSIIEFLVDKALETRGFKYGTPVHADVNEIEQAEVDDIDEDNIEDDAAGEAEEEAMFEELNRNDLAETSLDSSAHNILQALVDPIEWKTELERVGPRLRAQQQLSVNEWRSHVDQTVVSKGQIEKLLSETQGDLQTMNRLITEELTRMSTKEKYINHQSTALCNEYQESKQKMEELETKNAKSNEKVAKLTNDLAELTEKLDDMKESFESKDSGMNDTSPLVRIKAALQQIKSEINAFDLRIGVVSHSLLVCRVAAADRRRVGAAQKTRLRHRKKKDCTGDDDSILSGEDE